MLSWLFIIVILFILLLMLPSLGGALQGYGHSNEFRMIPTDESATIYVPQNEDGEIVFRPIQFSDTTTAPQRAERRTSTPVEIRSTPTTYSRTF